MTDPKATGKPDAPARAPKKKTSGIFDRLRPLPTNPVEEILGLTAPEQSPEPTPPTPRTPPTPPTSLSPQRDFTKVANSVVREAVAGGYFVGKSKQIYDFLYSQTRGAVVPRRSITMPKPDLMKGAAVGSERTLLKNLTHLKSIGLVEISYTDGGHDGNTYTVNLPEEVGLKAEFLEPTPRTPPHPRHAPQKVGGVPPVESGVGGVGSSPLESTTSGKYKTLYKTDEEIDDDDGFAAHVALLKQAAREVTGREVSASESERWRELAEVLVTELKLAAGRTTVSSVPAFLAEHLRRRLWKTDKSQLEREAARAARAEASDAPPLDAAQCPDCRGTGMFYPEGFERGVARCKHDKLREPPPAG